MTDKILICVLRQKSKYIGYTRHFYTLTAVQFKDSSYHVQYYEWLRIIERWTDYKLSIWHSHTALHLIPTDYYCQLDTCRCTLAYFELFQEKKNAVFPGVKKLITGHVVLLSYTPIFSPWFLLALLLACP